MWVMVKVVRLLVGVDNKDFVGHWESSVISGSTG